MQNLQDLEQDLEYISGQSHVTPYIAFQKIRKALAQHNFTVDSEDQFLPLEDCEDCTFFFQINYAGNGDDGGDEMEWPQLIDPEEMEEDVFLVMDFMEDETGNYNVNVHIMSSSELDDYIGDDSVEEL